MYQNNGSGRQVVAEAEGTLLPTGRQTNRIQVLGHRGAPVPGCPENSVAAVTEALLRGADGVEIDVWLSEDGRLVCAHELGTADRDSLASLTEVLAAAQRRPGSRVVAEAKPVAGAAVARATADALAAALATAPDVDITVSSFDPDLLAMIRTACADLPVRTALVGDTWDSAPAVVRRAREGGHEEVHLSLGAVRRTPEAVETARWLGLSVALWTVNRHPDLRWAAELGVDAVITDDVLAARSELDRAAVEGSVGTTAAAAA